MSTSDIEPLRAVETLSADTVADYLKANPDFFDKYPDLLGAISIPHESGEAVSIVERQVQALRQEKQELQQRFDLLVKLAQKNEDLNHRIQMLALELFDAAGPDAIFDTLARELHEHFDASRTQTLIFGRPSSPGFDKSPQFLGPECAERNAFQAVFDAGRIRCGRLTPGQNDALFGDAELGGSGTLLPLVGKEWTGIVAIHSDDAERFKPDMATDFLRFLSQVAVMVLEPWVVGAD